jgi:hypothetical protein
MTFRDKLFVEYVDVLRSKIGTGYFYSLPNEKEPTPSEVAVIATKMFYSINDSIQKGSRTDWLTHNPALKEACKRLGITTTKQLRDVWFEDETVQKRTVKRRKR